MFTVARRHSRVAGAYSLVGIIQSRCRARTSYLRLSRSSGRLLTLLTHRDHHELVRGRGQDILRRHFNSFRRLLADRTGLARQHKGVFIGTGRLRHLAYLTFRNTFVGGTGLDKRDARGRVFRCQRLERRIRLLVSCHGAGLTHDFRVKGTRHLTVSLSVPFVQLVSATRRFSSNQLTYAIFAGRGVGFTKFRNSQRIVSRHKITRCLQRPCREWLHRAPLTFIVKPASLPTRGHSAYVHLNRH